jgi:hypothetical protein
MSSAIALPEPRLVASGADFISVSRSNFPVPAHLWSLYLCCFVSQAKTMNEMFKLLYDWTIPPNSPRFIEREQFFAHVAGV